jgi:hypothetical protein
MAHTQVLYVDPDLGRIWTPPDLLKLISLPGRPVRRLYGPGEIGVFVAKQHRPEFDDGVLRRMRMLWHSITHNERVDAGANQQAKQVFGGGSSPGSPSTSLYPKVVAVANASLTKAKGDQSLGSTSSGVTTNEFTTIGLSRAAADSPVGGDYTAPSSLGGTFTQVLRKTFTASGTGTAHGAGAFDSTTVAGSILHVEDNFATSASLISADTLTVTITITN